MERIGRQALAALIDDPMAGPSDLTRLKAVESNDIWNQMKRVGNSVHFGNIPGLAGRSDVELRAVTADWVDISGWASAILSVGPKIGDVITAMELSTESDPRRQKFHAQAPGA